MAKLFKDLDEAGKKKAIEYMRELNSHEEVPFLESDLEEELRHQLTLKDIVFQEFEIQYSLSSCQGDGCMFTGIIDWKGLEVKITHSRNSNYSHSNMAEFELLVDDDKPKLELMRASLLDDFKELYYSICAKLETYGYGIIESASEDDTIRENIIANEYRFEVKDSGVFYI